VTLSPANYTEAAGMSEQRIEDLRWELRLARIAASKLETSRTVAIVRADAKQAEIRDLERQLEELLNVKERQNAA
jgi:hypothetical protein